jgi:4-amino-4-deoxy-L-arabinose transferase-like glycosyltransferase
MNPWPSSTNKIAGAIGVITVALLLLTEGSIGVTWDEPVYVAGSNSYASWFQRLIFGPHGVLNPEVITKSWEPVHEHPPLVKTYSGLIASAARLFTDDLTAHRLGNILLVGLMMALLYKLIAEEVRPWAGIAAIVALLAMPRFFFHAHLIELDVPAAAMAVIVTYVFWRTKESARLYYSFLLAFVYGLALSTKMTAFFILPTLFLWALLMRRKGYLLLRLALAGLLALPFFWALWPWLYYDTSRRLYEYLLFPIFAHWVNREYYLGRIYTSTPWHFPFVMIWSVVPLGITLLYLAGTVCAAITRRLRPFGVLLFLNALVPLLVQASGRFIAFDNERFLMPAFPFLAALAGIGFAWLVQGIQSLLRRVRRPLLAQVLAVAAGLLVIASPVVNAARLYPHLLSYYSEQVGGLPGAVAWGLEPTYWCETYNTAAAYLNEHAEPGDTIWAETSSFRVFQYYQLIGVLRSDVLFAVPQGAISVFGPDIPFPAIEQDFTQADWVVVQNHKTMFYDASSQPTDILIWMTQHQPIFQLTLEGVVVLSIYHNSQPANAPG